MANKIEYRTNEFEWSHGDDGGGIPMTQVVPFDTEDRPYPEAVKLAATLRETGKYGRVVIRKAGMGVVGGELTPFARLFVEVLPDRPDTGKNSHRR